VTDGGDVYVSDSKTSKIWKLEDDKPTLYLDSVKGANGLKVVKDELYYAQGSALMKVDSKNKSPGLQTSDKELTASNLLETEIF
jgi:hypothetical protein